ncbi:uncharacterized protein LOC135827084 [Sycon ciliatum]|uniref:uncharacterized protein LOC135827084 n=1 Tax=Sycon ciliatum TaxID=27933 RepID=UPI0031F65E64
MQRCRGTNRVVPPEDPIVIEQLIAGLQPEFGRQLRMSLAGQELTIPACLERVRALRASETDARYTSRFSQSVSASASTSSYSGGVHRPRSTVVCYNCNQPGHVQRNCPEFKKKQKPRFSGPVVCHFCDQPGHAKPACPERRKWREAKAAERVAAAGTSHSSSNKCLCAVSTEAAPLPRIYVDVESAKPDDWCRGEAMLDTGSARTLVSSGFIRAAKMCNQVSAVKQEKLLALDGEALPISGSISLTIRRLDGPVNLPPTRVVAFVVPELSVINADLLLGSDLVRAIGGVRLQYSESGDLRSVLFGPSPASDPEPVSSVVSDALQSPDQHPSRHVSVVQDGEDVTLSVEDGQIKWLAAEQCWQAAWRWKDDKPPTGRIGSGIGEYPRKLSDDQEKLFQHEVDSWIGNGWLIEHDEEVHGAPAAILPWLAVSQEHKPTTPVRPCLDYRALNRALVSQPGMDASVCGEKLREWRTHDANKYEMLDIRKAYLQVRMSPELLWYQCVKWRGKLYVMTRMAFGLSVVPKFTDVIVKWCTRDHDGVDNYVDDLYVPKPQKKAVADTLERYGLRTKPAEPASSARVLGLQLFTGQDGQTRWKRRDGVSLECGKLTKRGVFSWCGRLVSHYPVCSWLRPACSFLKRLACRDGGGWDDDVPNDVVTCCAELASRVQDEDPATGVWNASVNEQQLTVWCDASDVAYGIVAEVGGEVMEDKSWLRDADEKKHINIAELEAVIRGLSTAVEWNASNIRLVTDSKTVYGWVKSCLNNERRVKVSGLNEVLVRRRLNIIDDIVATAKLSVTIEWVPSQQNKADKLTRVPDLFIRCWKKSAKPDVVAAVSAPPKIVSAIVLQDILDAQKSDPVVVSVIESVRHGREISDPVFKKLKSQLSVSDDGYLYRSVKVPPNDVRVVPVVSQSLQQRVVCRAHAVSGHSSWETTWKLLRASCYFANMAVVCQSLIQSCDVCAAANSKRGPVAEPTRLVIPSGPWNVVQLDTLELGPNRSHRYHCVLVCTDMFTKWVEVVPLVRHDGPSVAAAFVDVCSRWGAPAVVRCNNGTEFVNQVVTSLYDAFGVEVRHGAVRHPQSQGGVERFNRTLLTLIRKIVQESDDWVSALNVLLYYYRIRPHSALGVSPSEAMCGWVPHGLIVDDERCDMSPSAWVDSLYSKAAVVRDYVESELSSADFVQPVGCVNPYSVGSTVMLRQGDRRQKRTALYESGWTVDSVVSPSTVVIVRDTNGRHSMKTVNIDLIKPSSVSVPEYDDACASSTSDSDSDVPAQPLQVGGHRLRNRAGLVPPVRYRRKLLTRCHQGEM